MTTAVVLARADQLPPKIPHLPQGEIVEAKAYPWSAIGKFNNGNGGSCTAVLISPYHALTAAHCLFSPKTEQFLPAQSFHLIFGYEKQKFEEHFLISAYYVPPTYEPKRPYETLASDWALLSIAPHQLAKMRPLGIVTDHSATGLPALMTAGYSHHLPYVLTADRHCNLVGRSHDGSLLFDSCKAPSGFSGAPVLVTNADTHSVSVAGIHVANQVFKTNVIAIAIPMEAIWPKIKSCMQDHHCKFQYVATGRDPTAEELLAGLPNLGNQQHTELLELSSAPACAATDPNCKN
jgi:protease YdgD